MTDRYIPDATYHQLLDDLRALAPHVEPTELVEVLGSAGVWPASCLADSGEPQGSPLAAI